MSAAAERARRLARLAGIRDLRARAAAAVAARARLEAGLADAHVQRVRAVLDAAEEPVGPTTVAMLAGAAGLRLMLQSALDAAVARARAQAAVRAREVEAQARADARAERTRADLRASRLAAMDEAEEQEQADRVPARKDRQ